MANEPLDNNGAMDNKAGSLYLLYLMYLLYLSSVPH